MRTYVFAVRHPSLSPPDGVLEVTAPSFLDAVKVLTLKCPGIQIVRLEMDYDADKIGRA